jgi:ABC-type Fe3+-hydroxamate transport system substrate-binding protein
VDVPEEIYTSVPTMGEVQDEQERVAKVLEMLRSNEDLIKSDSE